MPPVELDEPPDAEVLEPVPEEEPDEDPAVDPVALPPPALVVPVDPVAAAPMVLLTSALGALSTPSELTAVTYQYQTAGVRLESENVFVPAGTLAASIIVAGLVP